MWEGVSNGFPLVEEDGLGETKIESGRRFGGGSGGGGLDPVRQTRKFFLQRWKETGELPNVRLLPRLLPDALGKLVEVATVEGIGSVLAPSSDEEEDDVDKSDDSDEDGGRKTCCC